MVRWLRRLQAAWIRRRLNLQTTEPDALGRSTLRLKRKGQEESHTLILLNDDGSAMQNLKFEPGKTYRIVVPKRT